MTTRSDVLAPAQALLLDALRATDGALLTMAELRLAVRDRNGNIRLLRPLINAALTQLVCRSQVVFFDDEGHPRRWMATPVDLAPREQA